MSRDPQLAHRCPHLLIEEPVVLGENRRDLRTRAPIASTTVLRVMADNSYYIPSNGLYSQAVLMGALSGPFRIEGCSTGASEGDANWLTVTSSTESRSFALPVGQRVKADELVRRFRQKFTEIVVQNDGGYLSFADVAKIGPESYIKLSGRGAAQIGFAQQWASYGKQVYPGWQLVQGTVTLPRVNRGGRFFVSTRYLEFREQVRQNPSFKVTYASPAELCPRCRGTFIENDWRFDVPGDLVEIVNEDLLYQAALKILLTIRGSNPYHTAYGSTLMERIGSKTVGATAALIQEDVRTALGRMKTLQGQQAKYQQITLKERLYAILSVEVLPHRSDPTAFLVDVVVSNGTGEPVTLSTVFSVPGAVALAGTNNLSLGLDTTGLTEDESRLFGR